MLAFSLAACLFAGCAGGGEDEAAKTGATSRTPPTTTTTPGSTSEMKGAPAPPDVVPQHSLRRIRQLEGKYSRLDPRLEVGVRAVSGIASEIRCWNKAGWRKLEKAQGAAPGRIAGLADPFTYEIHLYPDACAALDALLSGARPESGEAARAAAGALVLLTHEGTHFTSAGSNEAVVECRAWQNAYKVAGALGLGAEYGRTLARAYWDELYPRDDPVYGSPECRDGGVMDVNPDSSAWP